MNQINSTKLSLVIFTLIILVALFVRLLGLDSEYLWYDECRSISTSTLNFYQLFWSLRYNVHPPVFFLLLYYYLKLNPNFTLFYVRLFNVIPNILSLILLFFLCKRFFNNEVAIITSILFSLSNYFVFYSQELRMYSLVCLLSVISSFSLLNVVENPKKIIWLFVYTLSNLMGIFTHYHYSIFLFSHTFFITYIVMRRGWLPFYMWIFSNLIVTLFFIFRLKLFLFQISWTVLNWVPKPHFRDLFSVIFYIYPFGDIYYDKPKIILSLIVFLPLSINLLYWIWSKSKKDFNLTYRIALFYQIIIAFIPIITLFLISIILKPSFINRYLIFSLPPLFVLMAISISHFKKLYLKLLFILLILIPNCYFIGKEYRERRKPNWQLAFDKVKSISNENTVLIFIDRLVYNCYKKYVGGGIQYYPYSDIFDIYKEKKKSFSPIDVLFVGYWKFSYGNRYMIISLSKNCSKSCETTSVNEMDLIHCKDVNLDKYLNQKEQKRQEMENNFDYYLLADSPTLDNDFYVLENNVNLDSFRWTAGSKVNFQLYPGIERGNYLVVFDIDTSRPPLTPLPDINLYINGNLTKHIENVKERMQIRTVVPLIHSGDEINAFFTINSFSPSRFIKENDDRRNLGFMFYSLGVKRLNPPDDSTQLFIDIGDLSDDEAFIESGFYSPEKNDFNFRWTNGNAVIIVPTYRKMRIGTKIKLRAGISNPLSEEEKVDIFINEKLIDTLSLSREMKVYELQTNFELEPGIHHLRIKSKTWNPSLVAGTNDNRELGICIDWIRF